MEMNGFTLLIGSAVIFLIAYVVYGSWLAKQWGIDPKRKTPAETQKDGIDYLPTKPAVLLGHHFSSIAGAGPIVGPITAAVFGWVPVTLWIIVGASSSAACMTTVLWWLLCVIKARVSAKLSKPTSVKEPRFSSPSLPGLHCWL